MFFLNGRWLRRVLLHQLMRISTLLQLAVSSEEERRKRPHSEKEDVAIGSNQFSENSGTPTSALCALMQKELGTFQKAVSTLCIFKPLLYDVVAPNPYLRFPLKSPRRVLHHP